MGSQTFWRVASYAAFGLVLLAAGVAGVWYLFTLAVGIQIGHKFGTGKWLDFQ